MPILVDASLSCNLNCAYCYNSEPRRAGGATDIEAVKRAVLSLRERRSYVEGGERKYPEIVLHGGEPTSWPFFEELLKFAYGLNGKTEIQTNATLIDEDAVRLFKKYKTCVGASYDGFWPLNRFRADEATSGRVARNIKWLKDEGISVGVITVVSRANGLPEQRPLFKRYFDWLADNKIQGRLNPCFVDGNSPELELTPAEALDFYMDMADYCVAHGIGGWSPFWDIVQALRGKPRVCIFTHCDPLSSPSGIVVDSRGRVTTCRRGAVSYENDLRDLGTRREILRATDCRGCKYFFACGGGCPSQAVPDWRAKTVWCPVWRALFAKYEKVLLSLGEAVRLDEASQAASGHGDYWQARGGGHGDEYHERPHADHWQAI